MAKNGKDYDYDLSAIVAGRIGAEPIAVLAERCNLCLPSF